MRRALFLLYLKFVYVPVNGPLKTGSETYGRWEASGYFPTLEQAVHHFTDLQLRDSNGHNWSFPHRRLVHTVSCAQLSSRSQATMARDPSSMTMVWSSMAPGSRSMSSGSPASAVAQTDRNARLARRISRAARPMSPTMPAPHSSTAGLPVSPPKGVPLRNDRSRTAEPSAPERTC